MTKGGDRWRAEDLHDIHKLLLQPSQTFRSTPGTSNMYPDCTRWPLREILDFDEVTDALVRASEAAYGTETS